jgi:hypothetical protein
MPCSPSPESDPFLLSPPITSSSPSSSLPGSRCLLPCFWRLNETAWHLLVAPASATAWHPTGRPIGDLGEGQQQPWQENSLPAQGSNPRRRIYGPPPQNPPVLDPTFSLTKPAVIANRKSLLVAKRPAASGCAFASRCSPRSVLVLRRRHLPPQRLPDGVHLPAIRAIQFCRRLRLTSVEDSPAHSPLAQSVHRFHLPCLHSPPRRPALKRGRQLIPSSSPLFPSSSAFLLPNICTAASSACPFCPHTFCRRPRPPPLPVGGKQIVGLWEFHADPAAPTGELGWEQKLGHSFIQQQSEDKGLLATKRRKGAERGGPLCFFSIETGPGGGRAKLR